MSRLVLSCLLVASCTAAPQSYQSYLDQLQQYRLAYLPASLNTYINDTFEDGKEVAYDLYEDIKEEVVAKSEIQVDALTKLLESFVERVMRIRQSAESVIRSPALTDDEIRERNDKLGLQQLQDRFDDMEAELVEEAKEDKDLPEGVEQVVQTFITMVRQMMAGASGQEAEFWAKLKSLEVQFWQTKNTVADASSQLRDWVREAFSTLESIDLNKIGAGVEDPAEEILDEPRAS